MVPLDIAPLENESVMQEFNPNLNIFNLFLFSSIQGRKYEPTSEQTGVFGFTSWMFMP